MEQASGSFTTGICVFSAHLPLTSLLLLLLLLLFYYCCGPLVRALRLFVFFQVNTDVLAVLY